MSAPVDGITPPKSWDNNWTQIRVRRYSRDYLRDLGKLIPTTEFGETKDRSINRTLEYLLEAAGASLLHQEMGPGFTHTPDPYCACEPEWPNPNE